MVDRTIKSRREELFNSLKSKISENKISENNENPFEKLEKQKLSSARIPSKQVENSNLKFNQPIFSSQNSELKKIFLSKQM